LTGCCSALLECQLAFEPNHGIIVEEMMNGKIQFGMNSGNLKRYQNLKQGILLIPKILEDSWILP